MIGGFKSSANKNAKQPVKNDIFQADRDLATTQPFPSFNLFLTFMLNQYVHDNAG